LRSYLLARLVDAPPAVRAKAAVFVNVNVVIAVMLAINVVVAELILTRDPVAAALESGWIVVIVVALAILRTGRYAVASNLTIAVALVSLGTLGFESSVGGPLFCFTRLALLLAPAIVYAFLVGAGRAPPVWATAFSLLLLGVFFAWRFVEVPGGTDALDVSWLVSTSFLITAIGFMSRGASAIYLDAIVAAEEKARESRDNAEDLRRAGVRFRTIFDSINEAVFIQDPTTGAILDVNRKMSELYGYTVPEVQRMTVADVSSNVPPYTQREAEGWIALVRSGRTPTFEWQARAKDGRIFWVEVSMCLAKIDSEDRLLVTVRDIERRKAEQQERASLETRLRQSEKMDAIGQLAGGVAHDFNNQLTAILGYGELLRLAAKDEDSATFAEHIVRASRRSADLTRQLLTFARKGHYEVVPVDVHALVTDVVALLERSIDKRIAIRTTFMNGDAVVLGDPAQLEAALLNLAINARDAMPEGGELAITTRALPPEARARKSTPPAPGPWIRISVTDTGTGMSEATLKRLFEPFFTTKPPGKGTGMGLASAYGAVQIHKGTIAVESKLGHGTTFEIDLPLAETAVEGPRHEPRALADLASVRVLVVDDEPDVRGLIREMLERAGCQVRTAQDGAEAVDLFREDWRAIDVVILDLMMPRMSGRDVFAALRQIDPDAKILVASGYSVDGEARALLDAGAIGFLQKPFELATLLAKLPAFGASAPESGTESAPELAPTKDANAQREAADAPGAEDRERSRDA
jgi:PAS domain S-box-containing protein